MIPGVDVRRLARGEVGRFQATMPSWNGQEYAQRVAFQERSLAVQLVAWDGEVAVGRGTLVLPGHPEWSASAYRERCPEIRDLGVAADRQRQGIGSALIRGLEDEARAAGFGRVGLGVGLEESYAAARATYARLGYDVVHGPFVQGASLRRDDGSTFPVAGVCMYLVKTVGQLP